MLTKFDSEFQQKDGEDVVSGQRWTARLQASLLEFFGKAHSWPTMWSPGQAFNNTFWLRSTACEFAAVMAYAGKQEIGIAQSATDFVTARRTAYLANDLISTHFAEPAKAWEAALSPGDGGISYLAAALRPICDPMTKAKQVSDRIEEQAARMRQRLQPYFHSGDLAAELVRAKQDARRVARALMACAQSQMFGPLMRQMQVTQDDISAVYWELQSKADDTPVPIGTVRSHNDYLSALGGLLDDEPVAASEPDQALDRFDRFADMAMAAWSRQLLALVDDPTTATVFRLPREQAATLVREVTIASRRLGLRNRISADLRLRASFQNRNPAAA